VRLWDLAHGDRPAVVLAPHLETVVAVAAGRRPDGHAVLAAGTYDGALQLWDPVAGDPLGSPLPAHDGWVEALAFGPAVDGSGLLASAGRDRVIRLWRVT
jgi:WD40 repeat protein